MKRKYRQMLVDSTTHDELASAKAVLTAASGGRAVSARVVIDELVGRRLRSMRLRKEVRDYIDAFVGKAVLNERVVGLMLFGSVARNTFGPASDIDVLVVVEGPAFDQFDDIMQRIDQAEALRRPLVGLGYSLRVRPMLLSSSELSSFRPIYIDLFEDGSILFERKETLTGFLNDVRRSVDFEKAAVHDSVIVKWRIRG